MDQELRNKLRNVVTQCRKLLEDSISQELEGKYGIFAKKDQVTADPNAKMTHLSEEEQTARKDILDHFGHINARGFKPKESLDQLVREIAFTHLNRLCAYKMMEAREVYVGGQKFREAVSRGVNSNGVKFYLADHEEDERLFNTGHQDVAYRHYLDWLGGALSDEIGVLFNPNDPANRLYPRQKTLDEVLDLLNEGSIKAEEAELREQWPKIWSQDETIGWVYQYFTPKELRDAARDPKKGGSQAPRNSYELAFRNQFFTPRYVVEFLTDNTLGRIWYEMRKGETKLKDQCRYMVLRSTEIFLKEGEQPPKDAAEGKDDLSQEELLKLPVHIPHRPKKDPREFKILDPACGSGHFLLYCFDLLLTIYEEAYADPDLGPALKKDYPTLDALKRDVPRLILAHNLHGIDIDLRASQIAALALWLRCQRAYQDMGLKKDRTKISRSNFVCAEPMPGEEQMLKEFVGQLEPKVLGQVVQVVFDKMKLAGEAGSLLKIEEDIRDAIREAKRQYAIGGLSLQRTLFDKPSSPEVKVFSVKDITDAQFFEGAESQVIDALRSYAEKAQNGQRLQRRLFSEDAVRGFAFVDLCQKRYDVVLMNPPFGQMVKQHNTWLQNAYPDAYVDAFASFIERAMSLATGKVGAITSRSILMTKKLLRLRSARIVPRIDSLLDLGAPVMDSAMVQSCAYVLNAAQPAYTRYFFASDRKNVDDKTMRISSPLTLGPTDYLADRHAIAELPQSKILYSLPTAFVRLLREGEPVRDRVLIARLGMKSFNDVKYLRLRHEVDPQTIGQDRIWEPLSKGGGFAQFYSDLPLVIRWAGNGEDIAQENIRVNGQTAQARQASGFYRRCGGTYAYRAKDFGVRVLPAGCIISGKGPAVFAHSEYLPSFVIGFLNSRLVNCLMHLQANAKQFDSGIVESLPWRPINSVANKTIADLTNRCIDALRHLDMRDETTAIFTGIEPTSSLHDMHVRCEANAANTARLIKTSLAEIDRLVDSAFGVDSLKLQDAVDSALEDDDAPNNDEDGDDESSSSFLGNGPTVVDVAKSVVSYAFGTLVGRWDVRRSLSPHMEERLPDPFANLPQCPPGMFQDRDRSGNDTPTYPLRLSSNAVLVDDPDHADDIIQRVREFLDIVWRDRSEVIEREICDVLGVKDLRDYFQRPGKGGFWDDHVARYTKSRRKAPIYWLLQSSKKNYALWLYYQRIDKDLLFKALVNYVEPKIRLEASRLDSLRSQTGAVGESSKEAKRLSKEVERQEDFLSELRDFEDKLRRAADLNVIPDLNDGVILNIAPLHELVPWKEAKKCWEELIDGKYEWSAIGAQVAKGQKAQ